MPAPSVSPVRQALTPPAICDFVRNCFTPSLCDVDFTQALRAIEYLTVLDDIRKREVCAALRRLNLDEANITTQKSKLKDSSPHAYERVCSIEEKSRKAEALYTQVYIGLRRWALINEMRLMPFNKKSCNEILDELYPSTYSKLPTPQLTQLILDNQREAFSKYIRSVEKFGRGVLKNLENQSKRETDVNGWPVVREILDRYLRNTQRVIEVSTSTKGLDMFERQSSRSSPHHTPTKGSDRPSLSHSATYPTNAMHSQSRRPSTSNSQISPQLRKDQEEWLEQQKKRQQQMQSPPQPARHLKKSSSTLGRLASEFRRMKSKSADTRSESAHARSNSAMETRPSLRSRPSFTTLSRDTSRDGRKHSRSNSTEPEMSSIVQIDDAYRERLIQEAKRNKENKEHKRQHSPTHFKLEQERRYNPSPKVAAEADRYFFITDAATRSTPMNMHRPFTAPHDEPLIAELAA